MARFYKKRTENKGKPPGSLIFIGKKMMEKPLITLFQYSNEDLIEKEIANVEDLESELKEGYINWVNIYGLHEPELIGKVCDIFDVHPLLQEDIVNTGQRAKFEEVEKHVFVTLKMLDLDPVKKEVASEQVSFVLGENYLLTFQERKGDVFGGVRQRMRDRVGNFKQLRNDYLLYTLLDTVVDNYIYLVEHIGNEIEDLEIKVVANQDNKVLLEINNYKIELNFIKKIITPVREFIFAMQRTESKLFHKKTMPFISDLHDIIIHASETLDTYRVMLTDYLNLYHAALSNKMNSVMKFLTIFSTIFIPLTFIAGIYGMNFEKMPELGWEWGYPAALLIMFVVGVGMLGFLKYKKWL